MWENMRDNPSYSPEGLTLQVPGVLTSVSLLKTSTVLSDLHDPRPYPHQLEEVTISLS